MARHYQHRILVTLAVDSPGGTPAAFRWRGITYRVTEMLARWHERDRWWMPVTSAATPPAPDTPVPKGPTDRQYYRLLCEGGLLCDVYYDAAREWWVLDNVLD